MKNKKTLLIAGIIVGLIIIAIILYFVFRKPKSSPTGTSTSTSGGLDISVYETNSQCPLKLWSGGPNVRALQKFLNASNSSYQLDEDGKYGPLTQAAVLSETGKTQIDCQYFASFVNKTPYNQPPYNVA